jgi:dipeptidase E
MPKLYLLGGENVLKKSAKEINRQAFEDAGTANVLVFPWARASFDKKYRVRKLLTDYFLSLSAKEIGFVDFSESKEEIEKRVANSTVVYLTGGQPSVLIERLKNSGVDNLLRNYKGIIVGRSAGALALCKKCLTTNRCTKKLRVVNGLNLVPITLKVHFKSGTAPLLRHFSWGEKIFAVPEGSALIYENDNLRAIGDVYIYYDGQYQAFGDIMLEINK